MRPAKKSLRAVISNGIILFSALVILEMGVKVYVGLKDSTNTLILTKDERIFDHRPNADFVNKYGIKVRYNSSGFIGKEISEKKKDDFRILLLGDSITIGTYLPEKYRYSVLLEEMLRHETNERIEVINGAVSGYNSWQEAALLKKRGLKVQPDLIIAGICLNDSVKMSPAEYVDFFGRLIPVNINDGSKARFLDFFYQHSSLYKIVYDRLAVLLKGLKDEEKYYNYLKNYKFAISAETWKQWQIPLREMVTLCNREGIKIVFVVFPLHNQLVQDQRDSYQPLTKFMRANNICFIDLINVFRPYYLNNRSLYIKRDIIHPNELGHKITAGALVECLTRANIL